ncbi:MAG: hypothetical protein AB2689_08760 [Candidatus Thiodiazotropha taylori]
MISTIISSIFTKIQKYNKNNNWLPGSSSEELDVNDLLNQLKDLSESNETTENEKSSFDSLLSKIMANDPWIYKEILEKAGKLEIFHGVHERMRNYVINVAWNSSEKFAIRKNILTRFIYRLSVRSFIADIRQNHDFSPAAFVRVLNGQTSIFNFGNTINLTFNILFVLLSLVLIISITQYDGGVSKTAIYKSGSDLTLYSKGEESESITLTQGTEILIKSVENRMSSGKWVAAKQAGWCERVLVGVPGNPIKICNSPRYKLDLRSLIGGEFVSGDIGFFQNIIDGKLPDYYYEKANRHISDYKSLINNYQKMSATKESQLPIGLLLLFSGFMLITAIYYAVYIVRAIPMRTDISGRLLYIVVGILLILLLVKLTPQILSSRLGEYNFLLGIESESYITRIMIIGMLASLGVAIVLKSSVDKFYKKLFITYKSYIECDAELTKSIIMFLIGIFLMMGTYISFDLSDLPAYSPNEISQVKSLHKEMVQVITNSNPLAFSDLMLGKMGQFVMISTALTYLFVLIASSASSAEYHYGIKVRPILVDLYEYSVLGITLVINYYVFANGLIKDISGGIVLGLDVYLCFLLLFSKSRIFRKYQLSELKLALIIALPALAGMTMIGI